LSNDQLKIRDKTQQEFIDVAAHELRTPIQPIISLSDVLLDKITDNETRPLIDIILRNAKRLQRLSQDILDITKIESELFKLNKEHFNLKEVISNAVDDYTNQIKSSNKNIRLVYGFNKKEDIKQGRGEGDEDKTRQTVSNSR
jgi:two-component system, OmpR family, sensor histidine kinase VicK